MKTRIRLALPLLLGATALSSTGCHCLAQCLFPWCRPCAPVCAAPAAPAFGQCTNVSYSSPYSEGVPTDGTFVDGQPIGGDASFGGSYDQGLPAGSYGTPTPGIPIEYEPGTQAFQGGMLPQGAMPMPMGDPLGSAPQMGQPADGVAAPGNYQVMPGTYQQTPGSYQQVTPQPPGAAGGAQAVPTEPIQGQPQAFAPAGDGMMYPVFPTGQSHPNPPGRGAGGVARAAVQPPLTGRQRAAPADPAAVPPQPRPAPAVVETRPDATTQPAVRPAVPDVTPEPVGVGALGFELKLDPQTVRIGEEVVATVTVENTGRAPIETVALRLEFSEELEFVSAEGSGPGNLGRESGGGVRFDTISNMTRMERVYRVTLRPVAGGEATVRAFVDSSVLSGRPLTETALLPIRP